LLWAFPAGDFPQGQAAALVYRLRTDGRNLLGADHPAPRHAAPTHGIARTAQPGVVGGRLAPGRHHRRSGPGAAGWARFRAVFPVRRADRGTVARTSERPAAVDRP